MPYNIEKRDGKFCVVKADGGKTFGCHPSKAKAQAQLRAIYANESVKTENRRLDFQLLTLEEGSVTFDPERLEAEITIVRPGVSENGVDHTRAAIAEAVADGIWDNSRMFVDHGEPGKPGSMEKMPFRRPLRDFVSKIKETWVGPNGEGKGRVKFINKEFLEFAQEAKDDIGVSMATWYEGHAERRGGKSILVVDHYRKNRSVDWVAFPAAGGAIDKFLPAQESLTVEFDELTEENWNEIEQELRTRRPAIFTASESDDGDDSGDDEDTGDEKEPPQVRRKKATISLTQDVVDKMIARRLEEARKGWEDQDEKKRSTRADVIAYLGKSGLPKPTQDRLAAQFDGQMAFVEEDVQTAVDTAFTELEAAGFKKKAVTGNGPSGAQDDEPRKESATPDELKEAGFGDFAAMESRLTYEPAGKDAN